MLPTVSVFCRIIHCRSWSIQRQQMHQQMQCRCTRPVNYKHSSTRNILLCSRWCTFRTYKDKDFSAWTMDLRGCSVNCSARTQYCNGLFLAVDISDITNTQRQVVKVGLKWRNGIPLRSVLLSAPAFPFYSFVLSHFYCQWLCEC